jgi:hypothetical protein
MKIRIISCSFAEHLGTRSRSLISCLQSAIFYLESGIFYLRSASCRLPSAVCLLLLLLLPAAARAQEVVDKMVATVNASTQTECKDTCLITYSDLLWQLALQPSTPLVNPHSETLNATLRLVEDQRLILQEAEKLPTISPSPKEIQDARDDLVKQFSSRTELEKRMASVGLTSEKLDQIIEQRVRIDKYLDFRFRSFIVITPKDISDYYRDAYVPRFKARYPGRIVPTLGQAHDEIEKTLTENKIESDIDNFIDTARERADIVILNPV